MNFSIAKDELTCYVSSQLNFFFPDKYKVTAADISRILDNTLYRLEHCFKHIKSKYYFDGKHVLFNHMNSDHYCTFLYFLSNFAYKEKNIKLAEKLFCLNKALNGIDLFYSINLPDIFLFIHPVGTVVGNASYSDYLVIYQNVTIGSSLDAVYPKFSENVILYSKSSVIGECDVAENTVFSANSCVVKYDVPRDSIVFGQAKDVLFKPLKKPMIDSYFYKGVES